MIMTFIILFLLSYLLAGGALAWVMENQGYDLALSASSQSIIIFIAFLCASSILALMYCLLLRPLDKINVAMKDVAKGNFSAVLHHKSPIPGLKSMRDNFNIMTHELSGMETLRNDFVVSVSHEFNTPLAAIEGYATLLQGDGISDEARKKYVEKIVDNVRNLSELTGNILRLSKLENQGILTESVFRLDEQIRRVFLLLEKRWDEKNMELDLDLPKTMCKGNAELMQIVWYNLISNAIKYSPSGSLIKVSIDKKEDAITVSVKDEGIGISEEDQPHVFEKFYQADKSHSSGGNGLGLALVKRIVELHGGSVGLESEIGKGSRFFVVLSAGKK